MQSLLSSPIGYLYPISRVLKVHLLVVSVVPSYCLGRKNHPLRMEDVFVIHLEVFARLTQKSFDCSSYLIKSLGVFISDKL